MYRIPGLLAGATIALVFALAGTTALGGAVAAPLTTYTVTFVEVGLAKGTSWSVTFNGVTTSSTTAKIAIKNVAAASSIAWSTSSTISTGAGVQFVASASYGYMSVPNQLGQFITYSKQVQIDLNPSSWSQGFTIPSGNNWYSVGEVVPIQAGAYLGYGFTAWAGALSIAKFANKSAPVTTMTVVGPGAITANLKSLTSKITFNEVGLPAGTTWSVVINAVTYSSATSTIATPKLATAGYTYAVPPILGAYGVRYATSYPSYGSSGVYDPQVPQVSVTFVKQYLVGFVAGTGGSTNPYSGYTEWVTNGTSVTFEAIASSTTVFGGWSSSTAKIVIAKKTSDGTSAVVTGTGNISAKFVAGTPCSKCKAVFTESGLPAGTAWSVSVYNGFSWVSYASSKATITVPGFTTYFPWSVASVLTGASPSTGFVTTQTSGYVNIPFQTNQTIVFLPAYYVTLASSTYGTYVYFPGGYMSSYWLYAGTVLPVYSQRDDYTTFQKWTVSNSSLVIATAASPATTITINGPGTITGNFATMVRTVSIAEVGLPAGTGWSVYFNSQLYASTGTSLNITGVPAASWGWSAVTPISGGAPDVVYVPTNPYGQSMNTAWVTSAIVSYQTEYLVTVNITGKTGGSVSPSYSAFYLSGTLLPVTAINATAANFSLWSSTAVSLSLNRTSSAYTYATVNGPGTISAKFV